MEGATRKLALTQTYRLHAAAGSHLAGELHADAEGELSRHSPRDWSLQYRRHWHSLFHGFHPMTTLRASVRGYSAALQWSKDFLGKTSDVPDGSGLDLRLETSVEGHWPQAYKPFESDVVGIPHAADTPAPDWWQRMELIFGPRAQTQLLNFTLPFGLLLGAAFPTSEVQLARSSPSGGSRSFGTVPISFYARVNFPGSKQLRGWLCKAEVTDSWAGLFRSAVQQPWRRDTDGALEPAWSVEHLRKHGSFAVPRCLADAVATLSSHLGTTTSGVDPAVVPSTHLRAGNDGGGAGVSLASARSGMGGAGWAVDVQVSRQGWLTKLRLDSGANSRSGAWGQASYTLGARAPWSQDSKKTEMEPSLSHQLQWMRDDGQGLWAKLHQIHGKKPRLNIGLEVR